MKPQLCRNNHMLWKSWTGLTGCLQDDCPDRRTIEPTDEIVADRWGQTLKTCPNGHLRYLGWRRKGCFENGCKHRMPDPVR